MPNVTNLTINLQTGTSDTYYASWDFDGTIKSPSNGISVGNLVSIKSGATYYNGVAIPAWVMSQQWKVIEVIGDRAVLGQNATGTNDIQSPINTSNLISGISESTSIDTLDHFESKWYYDTGNSVWFSGSSSSSSDKNSTYGAPSNALRIKVVVTPVSKTRRVNGNDTSYWTGTPVTEIYDMSYAPPDKPSTPSVTINKYELTASLENISDARTDSIQFEIYNGTKVVNTGTVTVLTRQASYSCNIAAGGKYRVRCRAVNIRSTTKIYGEWSDFSSELTTIPLSVENVLASADSKTSVKLTWNASETATEYTVEYNDNILYFDTTSSSSSTSVTSTTAYITGLESGKEWFFRVKATNDQGDSEWSIIVSTMIGTKPSAPTTWSSTTTAITGESLTLYWVHNSEDNSKETYAELEITIDGVKTTKTIKNEKEDTETTSFYQINTSTYNEGTKIQWRVRTAGILETYGDWSVERTVNIYAPPVLELSLVDENAVSISTLTTFPLYVIGIPSPKTQTPISYYISVVANETYETVDYLGNFKMVSEGEEIFSKHIDISEALAVELLPSDIDLSNGKTYKLTCEVSMNSGLSASSAIEFNVNWVEKSYSPDAEISFDEETLVTYIHPYCYSSSGGSVNDVTMAIYRREFDGSFTKLASELENDRNTFITDPHPPLNYARYRIVATSKTTGSISYYDTPAYPIGEKAMIIQWDEEWSSFDNLSEDEFERPAHSGSFLRLPYNIDISDNNSLDKSLIEYIGRSHPVGYYGTQVGSTSSWKTDIPKSDIETLYLLRKLAVWKGNVYVREPSGTGYWASISVSYDIKHLALTIPVSLDITRVEGGV